MSSHISHGPWNKGTRQSSSLAATLLTQIHLLRVMSLCLEPMQETSTPSQACYQSEDLGYARGNTSEEILIFVCERSEESWHGPLVLGSLPHRCLNEVPAFRNFQISSTYKALCTRFGFIGKVESSRLRRNSWMYNCYVLLLFSNPPIVQGKDSDPATLTQDHATVLRL